jgi:hypothetical protein
MIEDFFNSNTPRWRRDAEGAFNEWPEASKPAKLSTSTS